MAFYGAQVIHPKTIKPLQNPLTEICQSVVSPFKASHEHGTGAPLAPGTVEKTSLLFPVENKKDVLMPQGGVLEAQRIVIRYVPNIFRFPTGSIVYHTPPVYEAVASVVV